MLVAVLGSMLVLLETVLGWKLSLVENCPVLETWLETALGGNCPWLETVLGWKLSLVGNCPYRLARYL